MRLQIGGQFDFSFLKTYGCQFCIIVTDLIYICIQNELSDSPECCDLITKKLNNGYATEQNIDLNDFTCHFAIVLKYESNSIQFGRIMFVFRCCANDNGDGARDKQFPKCKRGNEYSSNIVQTIRSLSFKWSLLMKFASHRHRTTSFLRTGTIAIMIIIIQ